MKKAIRIGVTICLCVGIVLGYYYYLSHKNDHSSPEDTTELSEVDKIITKDFSKDYPTTPRAVVKWYNRIITAFYAEEYSDGQLRQMADQTRELLDEELLSYNPEDEYLTNVKADIVDYQNREKKILQFSVCDSSDITYATVNGDECAYVDVYYFSKEGSDYSRTYEQFVLRKDQEGKWKILTFRLTRGEE